MKKIAIFLCKATIGVVGKVGGYPAFGANVEILMVFEFPKIQRVNMILQHTLADIVPIVLSYIDVSKRHSPEKHLLQNVSFFFFAIYYDIPVRVSTIYDKQESARKQFIQARVIPVFVVVDFLVINILKRHAFFNAAAFFQSNSLHG
jgi:hypothetical protein